MNADQAETLSKRIVNIWRSSPPLAEWQKKLAGLDYETTCLALAELRDHQDGSLSIARFHAEYRRHVTQERVPSECAECVGTGWAEDPGGFTVSGHLYSAVKPCRCSKGRHAEFVLNRLNGPAESAA